jgi:hypothetical protein
MKSEYALKAEWCAEALFKHRFPKREGGWETMQHDHPDIAMVYRENARAFLKAVDAFDEFNASQHGGVSHERTSGTATAA